MSRRLPAPPPLLISLLVAVLPFSSAAIYTEISEVPAYITARPCIQDCAYSASLFGVSSLFCNQIFPASCLCSNLGGQSEIASFATDCASSTCVNPVDAMQAGKIWGEYCKLNQAVPWPAAASASATATATGQATGAAETPSPPQLPAVATADATSTTNATVTSDSSNPSSHESVTLPVWMLVAIAISVPTAVLSLTALGVWCFFRRRHLRCSYDSKPTSQSLAPDNNGINNFPPPPCTAPGPNARPYSPADYWKEGYNGSSYMMTPITPLSPSHSPNVSTTGHAAEWPLSPAVSQPATGNGNGYQQPPQQYFELPASASGRAELE